MRIKFSKILYDILALIAKDLRNCLVQLCFLIFLIIIQLFLKNSKARFHYYQTNVTIIQYKKVSVCFDSCKISQSLKVSVCFDWCKISQSLQ